MPPLDRRTIFLLDGVGALTSAGFLGILLPRLGPWIGMPAGVLAVLAALALALAAYGLGCFALADPARPRWLRVLAAANVVYCVLTVGLTLVHRASLTGLGFAYFYGEVAIILLLVRVERRLAAGAAAG